MGEKKYGYKCSLGKPERKGKLGRPRHRREGNIGRILNQ
jgi:hypothetical protein